MTESPLVSAVIVNWNGAEHLKIALPTLTRQTYSPLEILVVDNGSSDSSADVAAEHEVKWVGLPQNRGLAPACNAGAAKATGDILIFLNNDMRFPPDFVGALVSVFHEDNEVFAADARQFDWEGANEIHSATRMRRLSALASALARGLIPGLDIAQERVRSVCGVM